MSSPSLVPEATEGTLYFVLRDFGPKIGKAFIETDPDEADRATVIDEILTGQSVGRVIQVIAVDLIAGHCWDATARNHGRSREGTIHSWAVLSLRPSAWIEPPSALFNPASTVGAVFR